VFRVVVSGFGEGGFEGLDLFSGSGLFEERAVFCASRAAVRSRRVVTSVCVCQYAYFLDVEVSREEGRWRGRGTSIYKILADARVAFFFSLITIGQGSYVFITPTSHCFSCIWKLDGSSLSTELLYVCICSGKR